MAWTYSGDSPQMYVSASDGPHVVGNHHPLFDRVIEGLAYFGCEQTGLSGLSCLTPLDWATSTFSL